MSNDVLAGVSRETRSKLECFVQLLIAENRNQNLLAASTIPQIWDRHIADSWQLISHGPLGTHRWADLGTGPGLPGLVLACAGMRIDLVETRSRRVDFLRRVVGALDLANVTVIPSQVERLAATHPYDVIVARAFAPLDRLFTVSHHLASPDTTWILPKGRSAHSELDRVAEAWQGEFRIEPSRTDPDASIIVARNVRRREA